jgi:hypothetical protein
MIWFVEQRQGSMTSFDKCCEKKHEQSKPMQSSLAHTTIPPCNANINFGNLVPSSSLAKIQMLMERVALVQI